MQTKTKISILKKLKTSRIINLAVETLQRNLSLKAGKNVVYSQRTILLHLLNASSCLGSINHVSTSSRDAPTEGAVRYRLRGLEDVQTKVNTMLKDYLLKTLPARPLIFAIDFTLIPYMVTQNLMATSSGPKPRKVPTTSLPMPRFTRS